jgi:hypothetical protein
MSICPSVAAFLSHHKLHLQNLLKGLRSAVVRVAYTEHGLDILVPVRPTLQGAQIELRWLFQKRLLMLENVT